MKRNITTFILLTVIFLIFRLAVLFSYLDKLYEPEELYRGTIAREIINGPLIPLWEYLDYKVEYFPGGVLTVGVLAVPLFLLFGQTYIALKLVGLAFSLGTFILWYLFLFKFFSRRCAIITALLFIFCMPFYTKTSLITWGAHPEANFFTILSIFIFYIIFFDSRKGSIQGIEKIYENKKKYFFILGLISGFGLWFVQTYLLAVLFLFIFWFIFDKRIFIRRAFYTFCAGSILGFMPGIYYALFYKSQVFSVSGKIPLLDIIFTDLKNIPPKALYFLSFDLPGSFLFGKGFYVNYLYYLIFLCSLFYLFWLNRKSILTAFMSLIYPVTLKEVESKPNLISRESLVVVYPLFFAFCYCLSSYSVNHEPWFNPEDWLDYIDYRYMIPLMPFILGIIGIFIAKLNVKKQAFPVFLSSALLLGLSGNLGLISLKNFGKYFNDKGYSYNIIGDKVGLRVTADLRGYLAPFEKLEDSLRHEFYDGLGAGIAWRLRDEDPGEVIRLFEGEVDKKYQHYLYRGWGTLFSIKYPEEFEKALSIAEVLTHEQRRFFYEGLGRNMGFFDDDKDLAESIAKTRYFIQEIDKAYQPDCYLGLGYGIGFRFKADPGLRERLVGMVEEGYRNEVLEGIPQGMYER